MPHPASEIAICPILSSTPIHDSHTPPGSTWASILSEIRQQPGAQQIFWGRWVENQDVVQLIINWESVQHHLDFTKSPAYKAFSEKFLSLCDAPPVLYHCHFTPHPPEKAFMTAFTAPALELFTAYFPAKTTEEERETWYHGFKKFMEQIVADAEGLIGETHGWVVEEVEHGKDKEKCVAFVCGIGWESVDKHMGHRGTESFKKSAPALRAAPVASLEMHHVKFGES
ncbi:hypothetical protein MMC13_002736 [Lambiella insularis]|nr:hypothetical protein [Lambiella insularis]